jgi:ribosome assembly protein YihI (activator of Der GTPase)
MRLMKELGLITEDDEDEWTRTQRPSILRRLRMDYV